jgi:hypothetical protein
MRLLILISITLFGTLGGWLGSVLDHGNWLGAWGILIGTAGSLFGVWAGYKAGQYLGV